MTVEVEEALSPSTELEDLMAVLERLSIPHSVGMANLTDGSRKTAVTIGSLVVLFRPDGVRDGERELGASGKIPNGKVDRTDQQGELALRVSSADGIVRLDFGKPVAWIGLPPEAALQMASLLIRHAKEVPNASISTH